MFQINKNYVIGSDELNVTLYKRGGGITNTGSRWVISGPVKVPLKPW